MSANHSTRKFLATILIAVTALIALLAERSRASPGNGLEQRESITFGSAATGPFIASVVSPVLVGDSFSVTGSGFTAGSVVNFFVSTAAGAVNEGPLQPSAADSTLLKVDVPADIPLGQGVVALQVVNTDQRFAASDLVYVLLQGAAAAGVPSLTAINGVGLAPTSTDPSFAIDNVETVVPQGSDVTLQGTGFDTANGVAVDVFCACAGGRVGPFFLDPGDPALGAAAITVSLPAMGPYALPVGPAAFVVSNRGIDGSYAKKSNAVSVPIGRRIQVIAVRQEGATLTVDGTGFSTLTAINFFNAPDGEHVVNLGGLTPRGTSVIPITLVSDTELEFNVPAGAAAGPAYVQALNPPFMPFSDSGNDPNGAFILIGATPTPRLSATPTPSRAFIGTPSATPSFMISTPSASPMRPRTATPTATRAVVAGVLITGGVHNTVTRSGGHPALASAEIYDEAAGTFSATGSMRYARLGHTVTTLNNGKLLIAGGHNAFSVRPMPSAELYDVKSGTFSFTGGMNSARLGHTAVLLKSGKVLVSGGWNVNFSAINLTDLYDPGTERFRPAESLVDARMGHTATLLSDGRVLIAGGADNFGMLSSAELCDTDRAPCHLVAAMSRPRQYATATMLHDGTVLIAGGASWVGGCLGCATDTAEIYDPATASFSPIGHMHARRRGHRASMLPNGTVLLTGGFDDQTNTVLDSAEIYNPATGSFWVAASMHFARFEHIANTFSDGKVLIAGGFDSPSTITGAAELYDPLEGIFTLTGRMTDSRAAAAAASLAAAASQRSAHGQVSSR